MGKIDVVVIGASAGGLTALEEILSNLNKNIQVPIVIVQHMSPNTKDSILSLLRKYSKINVVEPTDKELLLNNTVYLAPADYHLMIEKDQSFSLSLDPKENYCRPSIDVLFETAAEVYFDKICAIILTGANKDGTKGAIKINKLGGVVIVQDPKEAHVAVMPQGVIDAGIADYILTISGIWGMLNKVLKE